MSQPDGGRQTLEGLLQREVERQQEQLKIRKTVMVNIMAKAASEMAAKAQTLQFFPAPAIYTLPTVANSQQKMVPQPTQSKDWANDWQYGANGSSTGASGLSLEVTQTADVRAAVQVQEPPVKKPRARRKMIVKQGSLQIELNTIPSPQGSRTSSRLAKQRSIGGGEFEVPPVAEMLPRRSPRLREVHAQGELPHRKRVCLRG